MFEGGKLSVERATVKAPPPGGWYCLYLILGLYVELAVEEVVGLVVVVAAVVVAATLEAGEEVVTKVDVVASL